MPNWREYCELPRLTMSTGYSLLCCMVDWAGCFLSSKVAFCIAFLFFGYLYLTNGSFSLKWNESSFVPVYCRSV